MRVLWLWGRLAGLLLFLAFAAASTRALAEEVVGLFKPRAAPVLTVPRDPVEFLSDLSLTMPRPLVPLSRQDAVALELLRYTRTMSETDALRTSQALCEEAGSLGWDPLLFVAMIHVESFFDHLAVSAVGAEGLMQLMPPTAQWMANRLDISWPDGNSFDPVLNVRLGVQYLAHLQRQFRNLDLALTAYNRGPKATRHIVKRFGKLPRSVHDFYSGKVLERYQKLRAAYGGLPAS